MGDCEKPGHFSSTEEVNPSPILRPRDKADAGGTETWARCFHASRDWAGTGEVRSKRLEVRSCLWWECQGRQLGQKQLVLVDLVGHFCLVPSWGLSWCWGSLLDQNFTKGSSAQDQLPGPAVSNRSYVADSPRRSRKSLESFTAEPIKTAIQNTKVSFTALAFWKATPSRQRVNRAGLRLLSLQSLFARLAFDWCLGTLISGVFPLP